MQQLILFPFVSLFVGILFSVTSCLGQDELNLPKNNDAKLEIDFETKILPLLEHYCIDCHAPGDMPGLEFMAVESVKEVAEHRGLFAGVAEQMESRLMPPRSFKQPTDSERKLVTDWLKKTLDLKPSDTERIAPYVVETYEDKKGNLWFGTVSKGAARYDGKTLNWYSTEDGLPSNAVTSFAEDKEGNLWLGTHRGISKYDGNAFVEMWSTTGRPDQGEGWMGVQSDKHGNIWTSTNESVFRFDGDSFSEFKLPILKENISSFSITAGKASFAMEDKNGNLWFKTDGYGAFRFNGKSFTRFTQQDGLCSNNVTSILEDKQGNIWFTCIQSFQPKMTGDGGVCRYDGKTFTTFPDIEGLSKNDIYTVYETRAGDIWIGASHVGVYRYDGKAFKLFSETDRSHSTRNFGVQSILEARNGTLWFGFSGGLFRFNGRSFFNITEDGPWEGLAVAMSKVLVGEKVQADFIHPDTLKALAAMADGKFAEAKTTLLKLKQSEPDETTIQERSITMLGYQLVNMNRLDLAIEVFKIGTQVHPMHFNAFDSLGEAYLRSGNEQLAIKNYEKSLELNPENESATETLSKLAAGRKYKSLLVAPENWMEEVIISPPEFAPTMSFVGMEHLRLPPEFRNPDSDWFCSYCFAIDLTEPAKLNEEAIAEQLLIYFRGLAAGRRDKNGNEIKTDRFTIEPHEGRVEGEFIYTLNWQEPFVNATSLKQNIRVNVTYESSQHGVIFVCASPQPFGSEVWNELLKIRLEFESAQAELREGDAPAEPNSVSCQTHTQKNAKNTQQLSGQRSAAVKEP